MICVKCLLDLPNSEFYLRDKILKTLRKECKKCFSKRRAVYYRENKEIIANKDRLYRARNKQKINKRHKAWRLANKKYISGYKLEQNARRRAKTFCSCCSRSQLVKFYINRPENTHVDHIVPLSLGGGHCIGNMQYLDYVTHKNKTKKEMKIIMKKGLTNIEKIARMELYKEEEVL